MDNSSDVDDEENPKARICCIQGCLAASAVGFSFLVVLPSGILLIIYSNNNKDTALQAVGAALVSLPMLVLIIVVILCYNQRRLARLRKNKINSRSKPPFGAGLSLPGSTSTSTSSLSKKDDSDKRFDGQFDTRREATVNDTGNISTISGTVEDVYTASNVGNVASIVMQEKEIRDEYDRHFTHTPIERSEGDNLVESTMQDREISWDVSERL